MRRFVFPLAALLFCTALAAQNLNPTVEVTNKYRAKVDDALKIAAPMAVPDTMMDFGLDFTYAVYDKPFMGSYDFSPYIIDSRPEPDAYRGKKLLIRAGAGYPVEPVFDLVWSPEISRNFSLSVTGQHHSSFDDYKRIDNYSFSGFDSRTMLKTQGRWSLSESTVFFALGVEGMDNKDYLRFDAYRDVAGMMGIRSKMFDPGHYIYDISLSYDFSSDRLTGMQKLYNGTWYFNGSLGKVLDEQRIAMLSASVNSCNYFGLIRSQTGTFRLTPRYIYTGDRLKLDVGLHINATFSKRFKWMGHRLAKGEDQFLYPDVNMSLLVVPRHLDFYASLTGGSSLPSYGDMKRSRHFFDPGWSRGEVALVDNSIERLKALAGVRGRLPESLPGTFTYDVSAAYMIKTNGLLDAAVMDGGGNLLPAIAFADYNLFKIDAQLGWKLSGLQLDFGMSYGKPQIQDYNYGFPPVSAWNASAEYNLLDRIRIMLHADGRAESHGKIYGAAGDYSLPSYFNLGLDAEYVISPSWSVWLKSDNILFQDIMLHPCYGADDMGLTVGLTFVL